MKIWKKWWFYVVLVVLLGLIYVVLARFEVIPTYQCIGSGLTLPGGEPLPPSCGWQKGPTQYYL